MHPGLKVSLELPTVVHEMKGNVSFLLRSPDFSNIDFRSGEPPQASLPYASPENPGEGAVSFATTANIDLRKLNFETQVYKQTKREMLASGWNQVQIFGQNAIDVDSLLLGYADPQNAQPVSAWAARVVNRSLSAASMPLRLALSSLLTKLMKVRIVHLHKYAIMFDIVCSGLFGQVQKP